MVKNKNSVITECLPVRSGLDQVDFEFCNDSCQPLDKNVAIAIAFHAADNGHAVVFQNDDAQIGVVCWPEKLRYFVALARFDRAAPEKEVGVDVGYDLWV